MASAFVVGEHFKNRVTELLDKTDSSLPEGLRAQLGSILENPELSTLSFSTARKLKKYLQDEGNVFHNMNCDTTCLDTLGFTHRSIGGLWDTWTPNWSLASRCIYDHYPVVENIPCSDSSHLQMCDMCFHNLFIFSVIHFPLQLCNVSCPTDCNTTYKAYICSHA